MKKNYFNIKIVVFYTLLVTPFLAKAAPPASDPSHYVSLAPTIPGTENVSTVDLTAYFNNMFKLGVGIAAALAVIMIVLGGIEYMSSDAIGNKEAGKEKITSALWGLVIALVSVLLLQTINPQLLSTKLDTINTINVQGSGPISLAPVAGAPDAFGAPIDTSSQSAPFQQAASQFPNTNFNGQTITANNVALDTDGTGDPGFDTGRTADGRPQHQSETSYKVNGQSLNALTDYYVVVPGNSSVPMGTPILITDHTTGQTLQAIAGDHGPDGQWGEMSLASAQKLGLWKPGDGNSIDQSHNISYTIGTKKTP